MAPKEFPELGETQLNELKEALSQWSLANGLIMYPPNFEQYNANVAPITLYPTPLPKSSFKNAQDVQKIFNELYINLVTKQKSWLLPLLQDLSTFDKDFTGKLFETYQKAIEQSPNKKLVQPLSLGLFRSDYMIHQDTNEIKQIEFNTVSVSFGGLSSKVGQLHNYLNKVGYYDNNYSYKYYEDEEIPISKSSTELAQGLAEANTHYGVNNSVILFIVQPGERNCFDQRHIEYALINDHNIKSYRLTLEEVSSQTTIKDNKLYLKSTMDEVSVVYYRSGYAPTDYEVNPEKTWEARLLLEKSSAIKSPSILTQLAGAKKVQQILTNADAIKQALPDITESDLSLLLSTFVSIYPLDDTEQGKLAKKLAFEQPENFVLKPQREGGGNNIYKENIPSFLKSIDEKEWGAYILMEIINPPTYRNKIIRNNEIYHEDIISELGIFGTILFNEETGDIISNKNAGFLLRSKFSTSNEGGVAAGFGCVDNIYLYE
ncbi:glutathione synthetase [Scheffersomyces amazonensis]|uniref:glutathione synthetase n=1 Tax=Scheffersomyces amazonensis TaxID=1078765 RepID=UPI00315CD36B